MFRINELKEKAAESDGSDQGQLLLFAAAILVPDDPTFHERFRRLVEAGGYETAALGLVERCLPGTWWLFGKGRMKPEELLYGAQLLPEGDIDTIIGEGEAATPPLAILTALVTALIARKEQQ